MLHFYKYQGAGNDFILIDNRTANISLTTEQIALLCHRKFGIGADGLMLLELADQHDFKMLYYNSDGRESTMCGNGGRCITAFAKHLKIIDNEALFIAIDGEHHAAFTAENIVALEMNDVYDIEHFENFSILNTGSPHYVAWTNDVANTDVFHQGKEIRNRDKFAPNGINVNFAQKTEEGLYVRTFERGVEDETLSCGTGVTACAIALSMDELGKFSTKILTPGGQLNVAFTKDTSNSAIDVVLTGPANYVFEGHINI